MSMIDTVDRTVPMIPENDSFQQILEIRPHQWSWWIYWNHCMTWFTFLIGQSWYLMAWLVSSAAQCPGFLHETIFKASHSKTTSNLSPWSLAVSHGVLESRSGASALGPMTSTQISPPSRNSLADMGRIRTATQTSLEKHRMLAAAGRVGWGWPSEKILGQIHGDDSFNDSIFLSKIAVGQ